MVLWALLVAVNALFQPYGGFIHDARLYAAQTLRHLEPGWGADLFFLHGSQDKFSVFSTVAAPVVRAVGLEAGFALMYVPGAWLFCFAVQRVCLRLVDDRLAAVAAAVLAVGWKLPFGGGPTFHVFEPFLTPRLYAVGFALLALDRGLAGRWAAAGAWLVVAFAFHPLMAFGGILLVGGLWAARWPRLALTGVVLIAAGVAVALAVPGIGFRAFGEFDAEWREGVRRINPCNFTDLWQTPERLRTAGSIAVAVLAAVAVPRLRLLAGLTAALGVVAVGGNVAAENLPYALPLQGQPYRSLWLVAFLQVPFAFAVLEAWGTAPDWPRRLAAGLAAGWATLNADQPATWGMALAAAIAFGAFLRPRVLVGAAAGFTLVVCLNSVLMARGFAEKWDTLVTQFDPPVRVKLLLEATNPALRGLVAVGLLLAAARWPRSAAVGCAVIALVPVAVFGPFTLTEAYRRYTVCRPEIAFVADHVRSHPLPDSRRPTVYWANSELARTWFDVGANSYFHIPQLSGNLFNRGTAIEGRRRAKLVRPFELATTQLVDVNANRFWADALIVSFEAEGIDPGPDGWPIPTADDLVKLCGDPAVDWVVIWHPVPGFSAATNGRIYIYDANAVRNRAGE